MNSDNSTNDQYARTQQTRWPKRNNNAIQRLYLSLGLGLAFQFAIIAIRTYIKPPSANSQSLEKAYEAYFEMAPFNLADLFFALFGISGALLIAKALENPTLGDIGHRWLSRLTRASALACSFLIGLTSIQLLVNTQWLFLPLLVCAGFFLYAQFEISMDCHYCDITIRRIEATLQKLGEHKDQQEKWQQKVDNDSCAFRKRLAKLKIVPTVAIMTVVFLVLNTPGWLHIMEIAKTPITACIAATIYLIFTVAMTIFAANTVLRDTQDSLTDRLPGYVMGFLLTLIPLALPLVVYLYTPATAICARVLSATSAILLLINHCVYYPCFSKQAVFLQERLANTKHQIDRTEEEKRSLEQYLQQIEKSAHSNVAEIDKSE